MASLILAGNTSGSITISSPSVSGSNTLTLPANTGTVITTGSTFAGTGPAFSVYRSSNQSISSGTLTKIQFNAKTFDTATAFDATTNYRFTPQVAGYYTISLTSGSGASGSTTRLISDIYKNGSEYCRGSDVTATSVTNATASCIVYLNGSTDYIEGYCLITGTTPTITGNSVETQMSGCLVRAA